MSRPNDNLDTWKVLIVDDEEEIHRLTHIILDDFTFEKKKLTFLSAFSGTEAIEMIRDNPDIALILLDVVMETDDAGLNVVRYIREELKNIFVQIVLRTGQAGQAPQQEVISEYEINDYNSKVELTSVKMITTVTSSLRAYRLSQSLKQTNRTLQNELAERKKAEEKIHRLTQFQENIIDNAEIWLHVTDENNDIVVWNQAAERISGYSRGEVIGSKGVWEKLLGHKRYFPEVEKRLYAFTQNEEELVNVELSIICEDGDAKIIVWNSRKLNDHHGNTTGMIYIGLDVTDQKTLENQFRQAQKMEAVGRMAGGLAHDFNNLLTVIRGYCELSLIKLNKNDHLYSKIRQIDRAAERAENLTRQLLAFSRHQVLAPKLLNLSHLVGEMEEMIGRLTSTEVELVTRLEDNLGSIEADPGQVEQIIMNLIVNAMDAMEKGGILCIETSNIFLEEDILPKQNDIIKGYYVLLSVSDTGTGMDEKILEHVFEPFFTTKEKGKGTGLGLSTVYGIVKQSNGHILVRSEPGKGTRFEIYFPQVESNVFEDESLIDSESYQKGSETILVVEDQPEVMALTAETLDLYGYQIIEASNVKRAMRVLKQMSGSIDLVLTDIVMPDIDGIQFSEQIKVLYPDLKIFFMSGYSDEVADHRELFEPGKNYIQKPFTAKDLLRGIRFMLDN